MCAFWSCPETVWETKIKVSGLINVVEKISRQPNNQVVAWVLLGSLGQLYIVTQEQGAQLNDLKSSEVSQRGSKVLACKEEQRITWLLKTLTLKTNQVLCNNTVGKMPWGNAENHLQAQNYKAERLCIEMAAPRHHAQNSRHPGHGNSPGFSSPCTTIQAFRSLSNHQLNARGLSYCHHWQQTFMSSTWCWF